MSERFVHGLGPRDRALITAIATTTTWGMLAVGAFAGPSWALLWLTAGCAVTLRFRRGRRRTAVQPGAPHGTGATAGVANAQERVLHRLRSMTSGPLS